MNRSENLVECLVSYSLGHYIIKQWSHKNSIFKLDKNECDNEQNIDDKNAWKTMHRGIKKYLHKEVMYYKTEL